MSISNELQKELSEYLRLDAEHQDALKAVKEWTTKAEERERCKNRAMAALTKVAGVGANIRERHVLLQQGNNPNSPVLVRLRYLDQLRDRIEVAIIQPETVEKGKAQGKST